MTLIKQADMVDVVDANGNAIEGMPSVPKSWLDTPLVPAGTKKGKAKTTNVDAADPDPGGSTRPPRESGQEPPRGGAGSSLKEWQAFAREKGAADADLLDEVGEELPKDALIEKYGTPPAS